MRRMHDETEIKEIASNRKKYLHTIRLTMSGSTRFWFLVLERETPIKNLTELVEELIKISTFGNSGRQVIVPVYGNLFALFTPGRTNSIGYVQVDIISKTIYCYSLFTFYRSSSSGTDDTTSVSCYSGADITFVGDESLTPIL